MGDPKAAAYHSWLQGERMELFARRQTEERHARLDDWPAPRERAVCARSYRNGWNQMWACQRGTYEDTTAIPAMRYTDVKPPAWRHVGPTGTLQIFSFKVAAIAEELRWPLDVYGLIAIRDHLDRNRNIIFARARDKCQTISLENPYLTLTGPTRAVVLSVVSNSVRFEVVLKVKSGIYESEDKDLSFLAAKYKTSAWNHSCLINLVATSKLSKLEWTFVRLAKSVEATINIQVIHGSWPDGCRGIFSASTRSLDGMKVLLLSLEDDKLPVTTDSMVNLTRHVACVEIKGELKISVATDYSDGKQFTTHNETVFAPREAGRSCGILKVHSCVMKVIVAWSLVCSSR
uniref:DUF6598 domain-containing protein n=1 Tax=Aegilops tauschii TaxID=37682 RepID=M8BQV2_AEGTA